MSDSVTALADRYRAAVKRSGSYAAVPPEVCAASSCDEDSAYRVTFLTCGPCATRGRSECSGRHSLCPLHTAVLRERKRLSFTGEVARIESIGKPSSTTGDDRG